MEAVDGITPASPAAMGSTAGFVIQPVQAVFVRGTRLKTTGGKSKMLRHRIMYRFLWIALGLKPNQASITLAILRRTHPDYRDRGVGGALVETYLEWAKRTGAIYATLGNNAGIEGDRLYQRLRERGFRDCGHLVRYEF